MSIRGEINAFLDHLESDDGAELLRAMGNGSNFLRGYSAPCQTLQRKPVHPIPSLPLKRAGPALAAQGPTGGEMNENDKTRAMISKAIAGFKASNRGHRRHPAEVLSDKLGDFYSRYGHRLDASELSKISDLREACERIAREG